MAKIHLMLTVFAVKLSATSSYSMISPKIKWVK